MKNYVIAAVVIILIIGGIIWYRGRTVTPVENGDQTATTTDQTATSTDTGTSTETGTSTAQ